MTYSFPCQDLSNVGAFHGYNKGIDKDSGSRSSLLWQVGRILNEEEFLLLDEPLNHLAFKNSANFNAILKKEIQNNPQLAVIMITHCRAMDFASQEIRYDHSKENVFCLQGQKTFFLTWRTLPVLICQLSAVICQLSSVSCHRSEAGGFFVQAG